MAELDGIGSQPACIERILNEKFLTLVVKPNGNCSIGNYSINDRKKLFKFDDNVSWSAISYSYEEYEGPISLVHKDNYRISKTWPSNHKLEQEKFKTKNALLFNQTATRIANNLDGDNLHCVIGTCAFVFDANTIFTESMLHILVEKNNH